jgi:hypothetical protein
VDGGAPDHARLGAALGVRDSDRPLLPHRAWRVAAPRLKSVVPGLP